MLFHKYFNCLWRADIFTGQTEYAVFFPYHERFFFRSRMAWSVQPFINVYRACVNTGPVGYANIKINTNISAPYPQLSWGVVWTPHLYPLELSNGLPF